MSDFLQLRMEDPAAKGLLASFLLVFVALGGFITAQLKGPTSAAPQTSVVLCASCGWTGELSPEQRNQQAQALLDELKASDPDTFDQLMNIGGAHPGMPGAGMAGPGMNEQMLITSWGSPQLNLAFKCPECGEQAVYKAIKCEKCGKVFLGRREPGKRYDACPDCGYSKVEERQKERRAAERAKKDKRKR